MQQTLKLSCDERGWVTHAEPKEHEKLIMLEGGRFFTGGLRDLLVLRSEMDAVKALNQRGWELISVVPIRSGKELWLTREVAEEEVVADTEALAS